MARWKYGSDGQLYYDQNDTGPDQGTPTDAQRAAQQGSSDTAPYTIPQPHYPSPSDPGYWSDPNRRDYMPGNPIWPSQSTDPNQPGYVDPNRPPSYLMPGEPGYGKSRTTPFDDFIKMLMERTGKSPSTSTQMPQNQSRVPGVDGYYTDERDAAMGLPPGMWIYYGSEGPGGMTGSGRVDEKGHPIGGGLSVMGGLLTRG